MSDIAPRSRGYPLLAWVVILGVVGFILARNVFKPARADDVAALVGMQAQGRLLVAMHNVLPSGGGDSLYRQAKEQIDREAVDASTYSKALRLAVLAGELVGPKQALEELDAAEQTRRAGEVEAAPRSVAAGELLRRLYRGYESGAAEPTLPAEEQVELRGGLGWFGDLALAPAGGDPEARARAMAPAYRALYGLFVLILGGVACLVAGLFLLVAFTYFAGLGRLRGLADSGRGGIYAETFAVYMLLYVALGFSLRYLPESWSGQLWVSGVAMSLSLAALAWPVARGVPWRLVRSDLGLGVGQRPMVEILCGVGTYVSAVPVLALGVLFIGLVSRLRPGGQAPTHPIIGVAMEKGWWVWAQVFVVACVLAPLVEEIMFRGALYRHLREACGRWGRGLSVTVAALASAFVFAVIHPQGWLAVPALGGLAFVFALAREWRGSLVPAMVAHGINNGVSTLVLLMIAS